MTFLTPVTRKQERGNFQHLLESFENNLSVRLERLQFLFVLVPSVGRDRHQVEPNVVVWLSGKSYIVILTSGWESAN